jgi:hypothetical protein
MVMRYSAIAILLAGVLVSGTAFAGTKSRNDEGTNTARVSELERRAEAVQRRANAGPGHLGAVERDELAREQREIRRMIKQLESGGAVEPREMDRAR